MTTTVCKCPSWLRLRAWDAAGILVFTRSLDQHALLESALDAIEVRQARGRTILIDCPDCGRVYDGVILRAGVI